MRARNNGCLAIWLCCWHQNAAKNVTSFSMASLAGRERQLVATRARPYALWRKLVQEMRLLFLVASAMHPGKRVPP